jgi:hypothetical protein
MRWFLAAPILMVALAGSLGCNKPDLDVSRLRVGLTKKEVLERVGGASRVTVVNDAELHEYEAYDRYGAIKINSRSLFIRFVGGKVESFGTLEELKAGGPARPIVAAAPTLGPAGRGATGSGPAAQPSPAAFDLKVELEKLEKLKQAGLISEAEFREFRQKTMDKARALLADYPRVLPEK